MKAESLLKVLTGAGVGSRRRVADAIKQGKVSINGRTVEDFRHPVNRATDRISLDGQPVDFERQSPVYLMLNKPIGILSTTKDESGRKTVLDILPEKYRHLGLYPVGRLDKESTGLLLLTNDGELTYRLTHPKFENEKEYLVYISETLAPVEKAKLKQGIMLDDGLTSPCKVRETKTSPPYNYSITMREGRKRQVRRMFAALGYRILALQRIRMGKISLGELKEGAIRELGAREISDLQSEKRDYPGSILSKRVRKKE